MRSAPQHPDHLRPGDKIGQWLILKVLGRGGFGIVFKVRRGERDYALKLSRWPMSKELASEDEPRLRMEREVAALMASSSHPNLLRVYAVDYWPDVEGGYVYFVTDYVDGDDWHGWRWRVNPNADTLVDTYSEVLRAVGELHRRGVYHRELKAENILIRRSDGRPFLIDFGAVRLPGARTLTMGLPPGTLHSMPPEALAFFRTGNWTHGENFDGGVAGDLYVLGLVLYQALCDRHPFDPKLPDDQLLAVISTRVPTPPHVINPRAPRSLSAIALRLMEKKPEDRYADIEALLRALEAAKAERDSQEWEQPLLSPEQAEAARTLEEEVEEWKQESPRPPEDAEPREEQVAEAAPPVRGRRTRGWRLALLASIALAVLFVLALLTMGSTPETHLDPKGQPTMPASLPPSHSASRDTSWRTLLLSGLCALSGWGCPAAQVLPTRGEPCPEDTRNFMFNELGMHEGSEIMIHLDLHQPGNNLQMGVYEPGPIVGRVVQHQWTHPALPEGTLLYGQIWTEGMKNREGDEYAKIRYTQATFPDGRKHPVCIVGGFPLDGTLLKREGSKPGKAVLPREAPASIVQYWP